MDLEVTGRHTLLFDDDASAAFVNSGDALVDWHSLQIDRYDVRHLLPAPPPSHRRNRETFLQLDEPSLQSQLDYDRYLDLILQPDDEPVIEEDEKPSDTGGYRAVGFSYGNNEESADQNNSAAVMESSAFLPPFPIPEYLLKSLPPTEKVHQIIARTATFVSKHGGQSEIILRVKQGDNPTFGFLMPGHHLHAYFRFLIDHPDLLHSEGPQDEGQKDRGKNTHGKGIGEALSLLGSIYGSVEEEDNEDIKETEDGTSQDNVGVVNHTVSSSSKKTDSRTEKKLDESLSRNFILSNREKVIAVKKNSLVMASKSGSLKGTKKEDKSGSQSAAVGKMKSSGVELASKVEPLVLEPPHELKRLIDKLVEFVVRNGKQFEATLVEQDHKDGRFPFLLPSNQYHSYYLQVLQAAQESKYYGRNSYSGNANNSSSLPLTAGCIPLESDRKEKFKIVIGKSKKELEESDSKATQHASGTSVDAATAAAILQAATRGIKNSNMQMISDTPLSANSHANSSGGDQAARLGNSPDSQSCNAVDKADQTEAPLLEEQKLKAERLKRAKMFVAMLKSGTVPHKPNTSRSSSIEPIHSGAAVNLNCKQREGSLDPPTIDLTASTEKPEINYFDEHIEPPFKRKYRSRSGKSEDSEEDDEDHGSRRKYGFKSRRYDEDKEREEEREQKHPKRSHRSYSSKEINDGSETDEEERDQKSHRSHQSRKEDNEHEDTDHRPSRRKHRSHHSSHDSSRKRRYSKQLSEEDDDPDDKGRDHKDSRKKHRSHRSSLRSRDKQRHINDHSSREAHKRHRKHHDSSNDEHPSESESDRHKIGIHEGAELEEGEISSRVLLQSKDIATGHVSRETSVDLASSHQTSADVSSDLRAKVRAMLMATRLS